METNLVVEGFKFLLLGMGTVYAFLIILIFFMNAMSSVVHRYFPEPQPNIQSSSAKKDNKKVIAAITAAIKHHIEG
jgi:oxaloacetate decarboxylase gamma subunit